MAKKYNKTPSQVVLNWIISKEMIATPRSSKKERIVENLGADGWEMEEKDLDKVENIKQGPRHLDTDHSEFDRN